MTAFSSAELGRNRLIAAFALLALLLGATMAGPRFGAAAGLSADLADGDRWIVNLDESQPAKVERGGALLLEQNGSAASPDSPPDALAEEMAKRLRPPHAVAARPTAGYSATAGPPYRRPHPTGPPLLG